MKNILSFVFLFALLINCSSVAWSYAETRNKLQSMSKESFIDKFNQHCTQDSLLEEMTEGDYFDFMTTEVFLEASRRLSENQDQEFFSILAHCSVKLNFLGAEYLYEFYLKDKKNFSELTKDALSPEDSRKLTERMEIIHKNALGEN